MERHLYNLKKTCPGQRNTLELTDEIKQHILDNRVYIIPNPSAPDNSSKLINTTINNYNLMQNFMTNINPIDILTKFNNYKNIDLVDIDDSLEDAYCAQSNKLNKNKCKNFSMTMDDFFEVVDKITRIEDTEVLNIIYEEDLNKLNMFSCGEWKGFLLASGTKHLIEKIQAYFLNAYEIYLLRKIHGDSVYDKQKNTEHLMQYYRFLCCFDITPFVMDSSDADILGDSNTGYDLQERYYSKYKSLKDDIKLSESNRIKKQVYDIIKRNSRKNIVELNKRVMEVFQMDESFKMHIVNHITKLI
jgi:hypothetical protein